MSKNLRKLVRDLDERGPSPHLFEAVMTAVFAAKQRQILRRRLPFLLTGLLLSAASFIAAARAAWSQAVTAGLPEFLSVAVTDTGSVVSAWRPYLLAVSDALPIAGLAAACAALFVFFVFLWNVERTVHPPGKLHHA